MKTDTCLFTRNGRLHLCVKQSFPSLSEVFTHGSQCGDTTNISVFTQAHIWDGRFISTVHFYLLKSRNCSEGFLGLKAESPWKREGEWAGLWWSRLFVPMWTEPCWGADLFSLPVTVMMHVLAGSLQNPPHPTPTPALSTTLPSVLAPLHSVPSSFSLHLPVFCALTSLPPALYVPVQPSSLFTPCLPFPLWWCPLTPHPFRPPLPPADGDPKSSCASLDCSPWKFFFWWLITVASKPHTKSQHDCYCGAHNRIQAVMAISNRRGLACERCLAVFRRRATQAGGQIFSQSVFLKAEYLLASKIL